MACLNNEKWILALRLPGKLYNHFREFPNSSGQVKFNEESGELELTVASSRDQHPRYVSQLETTNDTYIFSVDSERKPRFKGRVMSKGVLVSKESLEDELEKLNIKEEIKSSIAVREDVNSHSGNQVFKLNDLHDLYIMSNKEQAINKKIRKSFGQTKKRSDEFTATQNIVSLYRIQKYWQIQKLSDETGEPEGFIRPIMKRIARKVTVGQYRGYWELL